MKHVTRPHRRASDEPDGVTSKYLNAGGYIGPADNLIHMISTVIEYAAECTSTEEMRKTRECGSGESNPDQYLFKKYFWGHQDVAILDYHQIIFGNYIEIEKAPCPDGWKPRCAITPCCTLSDRIENFHYFAHTMYEIDECSVWRKTTHRPQHLPVMWHGNGCGKWLYLLSLDQLSYKCTPVAQLSSTVVRDSIYEDNDMLNRLERLQKRRWNDER